MWRWFAMFRCARCGRALAAVKRELRSPVRHQVAICQDCVNIWKKTGQRCARCWMPIPDSLEVGLLVETGAFVHVNCGGAPVIAVAH
jgi:DNA-directed RNA polymerase subunit RPC12/RpoP